MTRRLARAPRRCYGALSSAATARSRYCGPHRQVSDFWLITLHATVRGCVFEPCDCPFTFDLGFVCCCVVVVSVCVLGCFIFIFVGPDGVSVTQAAAVRASTFAGRAREDAARGAAAAETGVDLLMAQAAAHAGGGDVRCAGHAVMWYSTVPDHVNDSRNVRNSLQYTHFYLIFVTSRDFTCIYCCMFVCHAVHWLNVLVFSCFPIDSVCDVS